MIFCRNVPLLGVLKFRSFSLSLNNTSGVQTIACQAYVLYLLLSSFTFLYLPSSKDSLLNQSTCQLVYLSTRLLKTHSLFLTNATLKIENSALRLMPFHAFSPAPRRHFFRVNKTKRCLKAAGMRFFQHDFCVFYSPYRHYSSYNSYINASHLYQMAAPFHMRWRCDYNVRAV